MESSTFQLIGRCRSASQVWGQTPSPPLNAKQLHASRELIGDPLPDLLIELFTYIGNGGFGPQGGLLGLHGGFSGCDAQLTVDEMYHELMWEIPKEEEWNWPAELLPIAEGGCGLLYCLDLDSTDSDVHLLDPNGFQPNEDLQDYLQSCGTTLYEWLYDWSLTRPPVRQVLNTAKRSLLSRLCCRPGRIR